MLDKLAINVLEEELQQGVEFCRQERIGIEITAFAFPSGLDRDFEARIRRHKEAVESVGQVSLHGPFLDLYVTSADPEIQAVCARRHGAGLRAAFEVGASVYVAHLGFLPLIRNTSYRDRFAGAAADFWRPLADEAGGRGVTIVLENLWEPEPEIQARVIQEADHPHLKASFDNGHALIFSEHSAAAWIESLGANLAHCHLHDNDGAYDQHLEVGAGSEDWRSLLSSLQAHAPQAVVVLESDRLEVNRRSLASLRSRINP